MTVWPTCLASPCQSFSGWLRERRHEYPRPALSLSLAGANINSVLLVICMYLVWLHCSSTEKGQPKEKCVSGVLSPFTGQKRRTSYGCNRCIEMLNIHHKPSTWS